MPQFTVIMLVRRSLLPSVFRNTTGLFLNAGPQRRTKQSKQSRKNVRSHKHEDQPNLSTNHNSCGSGMIAAPEFPLVTLVENFMVVPNSELMKAHLSNRD